MGREGCRDAPQISPSTHLGRADSMYSNGLATSEDLLDIETMEKRLYPVDTLQRIRFLSVSAEFGE